MFKFFFNGRDEVIVLLSVAFFQSQIQILIGSSEGLPHLVNQR